MATVPNKDGQGVIANGLPPGTQTDVSYCNVSRSGAAYPAAVTPNFVGELYLNTATGEVWRAMSISPIVWTESNVP